jgi:hypothetical protein
MACPLLVKADNAFKNHLQVPEEQGPLITGGRAGSGSGAGIVFWAGAVGGGGAPAIVPEFPKERP